MAKIMYMDECYSRASREGTYFTASVSISIGDTSATITDSKITTDGNIQAYVEPYSDGSMLGISKMQISSGQAIITFDKAATAATTVKLGIIIPVSGGTDTSDATATAGDIKAGETAYAQGEKITGTFEGQTKSITASRTEQTVSPDSGKYLSQVTVEKYPDATGTYTYPSGSVGGTYDMGAENNLRYVNATNVYNKGKVDGKTKFTSLGTFSNVSVVSSWTNLKTGLSNGIYLIRLDSSNGFYGQTRISTQYGAEHKYQGGGDIVTWQTTIGNIISGNNLNMYSIHIGSGDLQISQTNGAGGIIVSGEIFYMPVEF